MSVARNTQRSTPVPPRFLGRGLGFPPTLERRWGGFRTAEGEEDVREAIRIIIGTARGERIMRPEFGCGIHELQFSAITSQLVEDIRSTVTEALTRFEARIDVLDVRVDSAQSLNGILQIELEYRTRTTNQRGNFVFPFYIPEGR